VPFCDAAAITSRRVEMRYVDCSTWPKSLQIPAQPTNGTGAIIFLLLLVAIACPISNLDDDKIQVSLVCDTKRMQMFNFQSIGS
jgi:hypothetical protein